MVLVNPCYRFKKTISILDDYNPNPIERNSSYSPERFLPIQIRSILCVFSTGEPCKDRLILTAIPCNMVDMVDMVDNKVDNKVDNMVDMVDNKVDNMVDMVDN